MWLGVAREGRGECDWEQPGKDRLIFFSCISLQVCDHFNAFFDGDPVLRMTVCGQGEHSTFSPDHSHIFVVLAPPPSLVGDLSLPLGQAPPCLWS